MVKKTEMVQVGSATMRELAQRPIRYVYVPMVCNHIVVNFVIDEKDKSTGSTIEGR